MANFNQPSNHVQAPQCLDDFALQPNSRYKLESILDRTLPFPANGICGIILYGLYGTGKTTMANLLPGLIDTVMSSNFPQQTPAGQIKVINEPSTDYYACAQGQNGAQITQQIQKARRLFNSSIANNDYRGDYHYGYCTKSSHFSFVLEEALKNKVFLETSSAFDFEIIKRLEEKKKLKTK